MSARDAASTATGTEPLHDAAGSPSNNYDCMLCEAHWSYRDIHNTARCPACGGGLVRDIAEAAPR